MKLNLIIVLIALCSGQTFSQEYNNPIVDDQVVFEEIDGLVAVDPFNRPVGEILIEMH